MFVCIVVLLAFNVKREEEKCVVYCECARSMRDFSLAHFLRVVVCKNDLLAVDADQNIFT
jgi:hypothetical protein